MILYNVVSGKCINATPGKSGLVTPLDKTISTEGYECFNFGDNHHIKNCKKEINKEGIALKRAEFNAKKGY